MLSCCCMTSAVHVIKTWYVSQLYQCASSEVWQLHSCLQAAHVMAKRTASAFAAGVLMHADDSHEQMRICTFLRPGLDKLNLQAFSVHVLQMYRPAPPSPRAITLPVAILGQCTLCRNRRRRSAAAIVPPPKPRRLVGAVPCKFGTTLSFHTQQFHSSQRGTFSDHLSRPNG